MAVLRSEVMLARCAPHAGAERARRRWTGGPDVLSESTVSMFTATPSLGSAVNGPIRDEVNREIVPRPCVFTSMGNPPGAPAASRVHRRSEPAGQCHGRRRPGLRLGEHSRGSSSPLARETFDAACGTARGRGGRALVHPRGPESANRVFPGASQPPTSAGESATRMARA